MSGLKKLKTTLSASFEYVVSMLENHEAIVAAAICEAQNSAIQANIQNKKILADTKKLTERLLDLQAQSKNWEQRAIEAAKSDKEKALQCLKRKNLINQQIKLSTTALEQNKKLEAQMSEDLKLIQFKIDELKRKRQAFCIRESSANAAKAIAIGNSGLLNDLDNIFDRWDAKLTESELLSKDNYPELDSLDIEFKSQEQRQKLEAELADLLK